MKKKILVAGLLAVLMLIVPLTAVVETINLTISGIEKQKEDKLPKQKEDKVPTKSIDRTKDEQIRLYDSVKSNDDVAGILPAFAIVRCRWKKIKDDAGERTIHFWIRGRGRHVLEWQTWDDYDGDGNWDLWGPFPPVHKKWIALLFPIRHFRDLVSWRGCPGQSRVMVKYWLDGKSFTKTFTEPSNK